MVCGEEDCSVWCVARKRREEEKRMERMERKEGIIKKKIIKQSFLFPSSSLPSLSHKHSDQTDDPDRNNSKSSRSRLFGGIDSLSISLSLNDRKKLKYTRNTSTSRQYRSQLSSTSLYNDRILKKTLLIESNWNLKEILMAYVNHQKNRLFLFVQNDKYLQELYQATRLWKYPSDQQSNMISFLKNHHDIPIYSQQNQLLETTWKLPKLQYDRYLSVLKEYFVLWEESLNSVCKSYFDSLVPVVYLLGSSSSSSYRAILYSDSKGFHAMIYSCPRGLYLKLIEMGIAITTLLDTPLEESKSLPIATLSEKVIMIDGIISIRLFIDALTSHYLPLKQSISSYQRLADNLPVILSSCTFDHSTLQTNTIDSYSDSLISPLISATTETDSKENQETSLKQLFQLTGYFTDRDIEFLCELLSKFSRQDPAAPRVNLSLSSKDIDHRVRALQLNGSVTAYHQVENEGKVSILLNPFLITKSDPTESTTPTNLVPQIEERSAKVNAEPLNPLPLSSPNLSSNSNRSKYFTIKLTSSPIDQMLCYCQDQIEFKKITHQQEQNDDLFAELSTEHVNHTREGCVVTEIKWNEQNRDRDEMKDDITNRIGNRNEDSEVRYVMEVKYYPRCVPTVIDYHRPLNQIVDEINVELTRYKED